MSEVVQIANSFWIVLVFVVLALFVVLIALLLKRLSEAEMSVLGMRFRLKAPQQAKASQQKANHEASTAESDVTIDQSSGVQIGKGGVMISPKFQGDIASVIYKSTDRGNNERRENNAVSGE